MLYFKGNQLWSILLLSSILGLAPELEAKGKSKPTPKNVCFLVGKEALPSDVVVDQKLANSCLKGSSAFPGDSKLKQLPDIQFNGKKFTDISYKKRKSGTSPVRFAMEKFPLTLDRKDLETALELYGAINAGLRSMGGSTRGILAELKG
ncbi:hypothetical protein DFH28DRAFT_1082004 [Melampsora americana]|nr:hypothetical protein DFH28DRAFT_1082004 [Melampsora americana]